MRILISVIITAVTIYFVQLLFPWWVIAVVGFFSGLILAGKGSQAFLTGFISAFLVWIIMITLIEIKTGYILGGKLATIFQLPSGWILGIVAAFLGGLVTGLASLTGYFLKNIR